MKRSSQVFEDRLTSSRKISFLEYKNCRNDNVSVLKTREIMLKNNMTHIAVSFIFLYNY